MARAAQTTKTPKLAAAGRRRGRPPNSAKQAPAKLKKVAVPAKRSALTGVVVAKVSKDELRAQVDKLQRANAVLRAKGREVNRAAKADAARIAELEDEVAQLEKKVASAGAPAKQSAKPVASVRTRRTSAARDATAPAAPHSDPAVPVQDSEPAHDTLEAAHPASE
jgi:hypothetical protein